MTLLLAVASAEEPAPPAPAPAAPAPAAAAAPAGDDAAYEVVVYAELQVQQARDAVVRKLEEMGYDAHVVRRGNTVVYRHAAPWYGEVVLHDDGWMRVRRQPLYVEGRRMPWAERNTPLAWAGCLFWPWLCVRSSGVTVSHRKWLGRQTRTVAEIAPQVQAYGDRVADLHTSRAVAELPDRLAALWDEGVPLEPGQPRLDDPAARRRALFAFWASRTDTVWGQAVREAVEAFCRGVVQHSDHPFTEAELDRFEAEAGRPFLRTPEPEAAAEAPR